MPYVIIGVLLLLAAIGLYVFSISREERYFELPYSGAVICAILAVVAFVNGALM